MPTAHLWHVATDACVPGAHDVHEDAPVLATVPAAQRVQFRAPVAALKVPASHGLHCRAPLDEAYVPAWHGGQNVLPRASHQVMEEQPKDVNARIDAFLRMM